MKNLPVWMGLNAQKAIIIAVIAESVLKFTNPGKLALRNPFEPLSGEKLRLDPVKQTAGARLEALRPANLHPISIAFILAEALDMLTTFFGLLVISGIWEANPIVGLSGWAHAVLLKLAVVMLVVAGIELMRRPLKVGSFSLISGKLPKIAWVIPVVAGLPVLWNSLVIVLEVIA